MISLATSTRKFIERLPLDLSTLRKPYTPLIVLWVLGMISVPIVRWTVGDSAIPLMATVTTLLQFAAVTAILAHPQHWGMRRTLIAFVGVAILTYFAEFIGSKTDFPFGAYDYTELLQPQAFGVPLLIPLAWFMMLPPAWAIAAAIIGHRLNTPQGRALLALLSAAAITAWDLFLDPQMVEWGFWVWANPSGYFGIPWVNFAGWMLTGIVVTAIIRPSDIPQLPLITVYGIVWALQSIGLAAFWGQPGPAFAGFVAMGALLSAAIRAARVKAA